MGNCAFKARKLKDKVDRHKDNVDRHEVAVTSTGEGVACTGRKTDLVSSCSASSPYTSSRIQSMLKCRRNFPNKTALAIESSKVHWSELDPPSDSDDHYSPESDRLYFDEVLKHRPAWVRFCFFRDFDDLEIGGKLAEGAQGEVYFAHRTRYGGRYAVKMFKKGVPLRLLLQKMPPSMLSAAEYDIEGSPLECIVGVTMMTDERFKNRIALVMECQTCDPRKLIDDRMLSKNNQGPPFTISPITKFLHKIAKDMVSLHDQCGIIHKDLKASNVLVTAHRVECSIGDLRYGTPWIAGRPLPR